MTEPARNLEPTDLDTLMHEWTTLKQTEQNCADRRRKIEDRIVSIVGCKDEGSQTTETAFYRLTVTSKINRAIDAAALSAVQSGVPSAIFDRVFRYEPKLDLKQLRYVQLNEPDIYATIAQAITAKPGKPSIKIEEIDAAEEAR